MSSYPAIPTRLSSLAEWNNQQLRLQQSQRDLKRKMSETSMEYQKLKIERLQVVEAKEYHKQAYLELQHDNKDMKCAGYKRA